MNRDVKIIVAGTQDDGSGNKTVTDFQTVGQYFERNGCRYLLYREQDTESKAITANTLKLRDNVMELSRKGNIHSRMVFEAGQTHPTDYVTAWGVLQMEVCTEDLKYQWTETEAGIRITYRLLMAGEFLSRTELVIKIRNISAKN